MAPEALVPAVTEDSGSAQGNTHNCAAASNWIAQIMGAVSCIMADAWLKRLCSCFACAAHYTLPPYFWLSPVSSSHTYLPCKFPPQLPLSFRLALPFLLLPSPPSSSFLQVLQLAVLSFGFAW